MMSIYTGSDSLERSGVNNRGLTSKISTFVAGAFLALAVPTHAQNPAASPSSTNAAPMPASSTLAPKARYHSGLQRVISAQEYEDLKKERDSLKDNLGCIMTDYTSAQTRLEATMIANEGLSTDIKRGAKQIEDLRGKVARIEKEFGAYRENKETIITNLQASLRKLQGEHGKLSGKYDAATRERKSLTEELKRRNVEYETIRIEFECLQTVYQGLEKDLSDSNGTVERFKERIAGLNVQISEYRAHEAKRNAEEIAKRAADEKALREGALVYQLTTSEAFNLPPYPWAVAKFNESTRTFGDITEVSFTSSPEGRLIDSNAELGALASGVSKVYNPTFPNKRAFEQLSAAAGLDSAFSATLEGGREGYTEFDALAQFAADYGKAQKANPRNPVVLSVDCNNNVVVFGSYEALKNVKGGSL